MKKILLIAFALITFNTFAQLNASAQAVKSERPESYEAIKEWSQNQWTNDHSMVLYEINKQSTAYIEIVIIMSGDLSDEDETIMANAYIEWTGKITDKMFVNSTVDWSMVLYEYNRQITAKSAY